MGLGEDSHIKMGLGVKTCQMCTGELNMPGAIREAQLAQGLSMSSRREGFRVVLTPNLNHMRKYWGVRIHHLL